MVTRFECNESPYCCTPYCTSCDYGTDFVDKVNERFLHYHRTTESISPEKAIDLAWENLTWAK